MRIHVSSCIYGIAEFQSFEHVCRYGNQAAPAVKPGVPELPPEETEVKRSLDAVRHAPLEARKRHQALQLRSPDLGKLLTL